MAFKETALATEPPSYLAWTEENRTSLWASISPVMKLWFVVMAANFVLILSLI